MLGLMLHLIQDWGMRNLERQQDIKIGERQKAQAQR